GLTFPASLSRCWSSSNAVNEISFRLRLLRLSLPIWIDGLRDTLITSPPIRLRVFWKYLASKATAVVDTITENTPTTRASSVSDERSLLAHSESKACLKVSFRFMLFVPKRFYGIGVGCPISGDKTKNKPHQRTEYKGSEDDSQIYG